MRRYTWRTGIVEAGTVLVALVFMFPIYLLVNLAIRPSDDVSSPLVPTTSPTGANFVSAWTQASLGAATLNSAVVTIISVTLIVVLASLAAYGLVRATTRWSSASFYLLMIGLLLPLQLSLVPLYKLMREAGLLGTLLPLVVIYVGFRLPFSVFFYSQFLRQIPIEYEEAAAVDGCGSLRTFVKVVFPLLRPVTGTLIILNGLFIWNDFLMPLVFLSGVGSQTLPVAIYSFVGEYVTNWPVVFAALIIGAVPVLIAFFFIQKSLIRGLASGVKG